MPAPHIDTAALIAAHINTARPTSTALPAASSELHSDNSPPFTLIQERKRDAEMIPPYRSNGEMGGVPNPEGRMMLDGKPGTLGSESEKRHVPKLYLPKAPDEMVQPHVPEELRSAPVQESWAQRTDVILPVEKREVPVEVLDVTDATETCDAA